MQTRVQELKIDLSSRSPDDRGMGAGDRHRARDDMEVDVDGEDENEEEYAANRKAVLPNAREFAQLNPYDQILLYPDGVDVAKWSQTRANDLRDFEGSLSSKRYLKSIFL